MAFLTSYRTEKVYFEKLRSNIDIAKSYIQRGATDEVMALLQNAVDADGAIMLCYRNLGEVWADLAAQLEKTQKALEDLKTALEEYHDDLNKKIDEINNYLVRLINALDERVTILENESKVKFAYLNHDSVENVYSIEYNGETADFDTLSAALEYPHLLVLIDNENGNIYYPRSVSDVLIDFHADGVSGTDYVDISVTMSDSDVVTVTEKTVVNYTFGTGFNVSNTNEVTPDLNVLQAKLSAGFGIEIDSTNEISVDTNDVQEKLIAGQNITLTPDSTDPTKTVIDAAGGANYSAGIGIEITNDNVINTRLFGFKSLSPAVTSQYSISFTAQDTQAYKQFLYDNVISSSVFSYATLKDIFDSCNSFQFTSGLITFAALPSSNDYIEFITQELSVYLSPTSGSGTITLFNEKNYSLLASSVKGNTDHLNFGFARRINGIKNAFALLDSTKSYKLYARIKVLVKYNGTIYNPSAFNALFPNCTLSANVSLSKYE